MRKQFLNFPLLKEDEMGKLIGGFSYALSAESTQVGNNDDKRKRKSGKYNHNCLGGNCKAGCGAGQKRRWKIADDGPLANNCKGMNCGC